MCKSCSFTYLIFFVISFWSKTDFISHWYLNYDYYFQDQATDEVQDQATDEIQDQATDEIQDQATDEIQDDNTCDQENIVQDNEVATSSTQEVISSENAQRLGGSNVIVTFSHVLV